MLNFERIDYIIVSEFGNNGNFFYLYEKKLVLFRDLIVYLIVGLCICGI